MQNNYFRKILIFFLFFIVLWGKNFDTLLDTLNQEERWITVNYLNDGSRFEKMTLIGKDLYAVKVSKKTNIYPNYIRNVIMKLDRYGEFLSNANTISSEVLKITNDYVDGFQHIQVSLPFFSDRQYCFRMIEYEWSKDSNNVLVDWYLLDKEGDYASFIDQKDHNAVYLNIGAGSWSAKPLDEGHYEVSYRLYMDPGGSIPDFLTQRINAISIINLFQDVLLEAKRRMKVQEQQKLSSPENTTGLRSYRF